MSQAKERRIAAVLGWPVEHSKSPQMHNAAFAALGIAAEYQAMAVEAAALPEAIAGLRRLRCLGASITVPHKAAVIKECDALSDAARVIGAVNTLEFREDGTICGHNTDAPGYVRALREASGEEVEGRRVILLGGGGAARAVAYGLKDAGVASIRTIVRSPAKVDWTSAEPWEEELLSAALRECDLLVDCTSMGLDAARETQIPAPVALDQLPLGAIVSTLVYHRETKLLADAAMLGLRCVGGSDMLLFQGAIAFEIWTGQAAPVEVMRKALL